LLVLRKKPDGPSKASIPELEFEKTELKSGQKWNDGEKEFLQELDQMPMSEASKLLLKPCVYKKR
jgi:hypothetical protein